MNSSLPSPSAVRGALAGILASHSLDELTFEEVFLILQANFVCSLSPIAQEIKKQLQILLFQAFVDGAKQMPSPGKGIIPSPERPRERNRAPIKKLLMRRICDFKKRRSVDLVTVIESITAAQGGYYPIDNIIDDDPQCFWITTGLFPQLIRIQLRCPCSLEKVIIEGKYLSLVRIEIERIVSSDKEEEDDDGEEDDDEEDSKRTRCVSPSRGGHRKSLSIIDVDYRSGRDIGGELLWEAERLEEDYHFETKEILMDYRFTCCLLIYILQSCHEFCIIRRLRLHGIAVELFH